jgi:hypothetical protein
MAMTQKSIQAPNSIRRASSVLVPHGHCCKRRTFNYDEARALDSPARLEGSKTVQRLAGVRLEKEEKG